MIRADFPNLDLMVGGQAFRWGGVETIKRYPGTAYIPSLNELEVSIGEDRGHG